ncbi:hypothetical protein GOA58_31775 [Sinorhizobium meliloti]|nr:hypothetical protein [Sinorhizobium meliloti]MDW9664935.1 hypothetical protein [Sinorhizobium meliloti]MDX0054742.1 hypothetical protein [Sinorhizobium meliloti]
MTDDKPSVVLELLLCALWHEVGSDIDERFDAASSAIGDASTCLRVMELAAQVRHARDLNAWFPRGGSVCLNSLAGC